MTPFASKELGGRVQLFFWVMGIHKYSLEAVKCDGRNPVTLNR